MSLKEYGDSGTALSDPSPTVDHKGENQMLEVPVFSIVPSLTNPRKKFDQVKLRELADNIALRGVMQSVLVRPLPGTRLASTFDFRRAGTPLPIYELVAGERRYRASRLAEIETIPVMVRNLTDDEVLGIQLAENMHRDDLTAMEEAEGFSNWMAHSGLTAEQVAERVNKSRRHVFNRLQLLKLCIEARTAYESGTIELSHALPIANIPDTKLQLKALARATEVDYKGEKPSAREFAQWIRENVMKRLDGATFDREDMTLHATAGGCQACPKRTGASPDLFSYVNAPDICTDPACYDAKAEAHHHRVIAIAQKKGMKVIEGKEAKAIVPTYTGHELRGGYSRLDQRRYDTVGKTDQAPTLRALLGKDAPQPVLIEDPRTKELIEAVPTAEAEAVLVRQGMIRITKKESNALQRIENLQHNFDQGLRRTLAREVRRKLIDSIHGSADGLAASLVSAELIRAWLLDEMPYMDDDDVRAALRLPAEGNGSETENIAPAIHAASDALLFRAMAVIMLLNEQQSYSPKEKDAFACARAIGTTLSVDIDAIVKETTATEKKALQAAVRAIKAEASEAAAPPSETAARGDEGAGTQRVKKTVADGGTGARKSTGKAGKKATAEETAQGIAAALQSIEAPALAGAGATEAVQTAAPSEGDTVQGIADAVQGEGAAAATAAAKPGDLAVPTLKQPPATIELGRLVQVNASATSTRAKRYVGKVGTVNSKAGPEAWFVEFPGKKGKTVSDCSFHNTELQTPVPGVGLKVKVAHYPMLGTHQKYYNKVGKVQEAAEGGKWSVIFPGKLAIYGTFAAHDLEVVL